MFHAKFATRLVISLFICGIICSCIYVAGATGKKKLPQKRTTVDSDYKYYECPPAKTLAAKVGAIGKTIDGAFTKGSALRMIIPGNYFKVYRYANDSSEIVSWICNDCKKSKVAESLLGNETTTFPFDGNLTEASDTVQFIDEQDKKNIIFSFATYPLQLSMDDLHSGRFSGTYLGLVRFREENGKWVLKNYTNGLGCYGMFKYLPKIHLIQLGHNNYGCYLLNVIGGPGQVNYSQLEVFGIVNNQFKLILSESDVARTNTLTSNWHMELTQIEKLGAVFSPLQLTIAGDFNNTDLDFVDDTTSNAPTELHTKMKTSQKFDFKVVREYGFKGGKYVKEKGGVE